MGRIVDIPFGYGITGIPRRSHTVKDIHVVDVVPVELPEFAFADLAPAVRVKGTDGAADLVISSCLGGYVSSEPEVGMTLDRFRHAVDTLPAHQKRRVGFMDHLPGFHSVLGVERRGETVDMMHSEVEGGLRTLISSNEAAVRKEFHDKVVPTLAIVDGSVVQVQDEPVWKASLRQTIGQPDAVMHVGFAESYRPDWTWSFRLDGFERAKASFETPEGRFKDERERVTDLGVVRWTLDEVRASAATFSLWLKDRLSLPVATVLFDKASPEFFRACCAIRDWETSSNDETVHAAQVLVEEVERMDTGAFDASMIARGARRHLLVAALQPNPDAELLGQLRI